MATISYVKPGRPAVHRPSTSSARTQLRYWIDQYIRLTSELQVAKVRNADQWVKGKVDTRDLYNRRAAAAGQMARFGSLVLAETD